MGTSPGRNADGRGGPENSSRRRHRTAPRLEILDPRLAPSADVTGLWQGTLTQPGGLQSSYNFVLDLSDDAGTVQGVSRIELDQTQYFGVMTLIGTVSGSTLTFQEQSILYQDIPSGYAWDLKFAVLQVSTDGTSMSGPWAAAPTGSPLGTVDVAQASLPNPSLAGSWQGTLTDPSSPGVTLLFSLGLDLSQDQDMIQGLEAIQFQGPGGDSADIKLTGIVIGDEFLFQETTITQQDPPDNVWLIKSGNLQISTAGTSMTGPWNSSIYSGTMDLNMVPATPTPTPTPTPLPSPSPTSPPTAPITSPGAPSPIPTSPLPTPTPTPGFPAPGSLRTRTSLSARPRVTISGRSVRLTARVAILGRHASGVAIGTVRFLDGTIVLGTVSLGRGKATLVASSLPLGANVIQVQYVGGGDFLASESNLVVEKVKPHRS